MAIESSKSDRVQVEHLGDSVQIAIASKASILHMIFITVWLGIWLFAGTRIFQSMNQKPSDWFLKIWMVAWAFGALYVLFMLIWMIAGGEKITVSSLRLKIERKVFGLGITKEYDMAEIKRLRIHPETIEIVDNGWGWGRTRAQRAPWRVTGNGRISFDYGQKTIRFAESVDDAEANYIIDEIQKRYRIKE